MKKFIVFSLILMSTLLLSCGVDTEINLTTDAITSSTINQTSDEFNSTTVISSVVDTTVTNYVTSVTTSVATTLPLTTIPTTLEPTTTTTTKLVLADNPDFVLQMQADSLKILQLTDLHLLYDSEDTVGQTLDLITRLIESDDFDLVVITGDMMLSSGAPFYFGKLIKTMEAYETPWTFVFGNHDNDYHDYNDLLAAIPETEYLYFTVGPELEAGGYGNFEIQFQNNSVPFYNLFFMDSHAEREVFLPEEGRYDYIKASQVEWYRSKMLEGTVDNLVFMHMPLRQYLSPTGYIGEFGEYVCAQGIDTGLFDAFVEFSRTKAMFVGHDHLNDFYFMQDGIMLAYGRSTGFGGYGDLEKGGRIIEISAEGVITTSIILDSDV